ncbi:TolC family protein [Gracilinema caldarium]|jgi:outer membrane protein TolC|uniref:TolC family protein n=1 Tax=Gracilinema caldarium TaxID=215591 RepID=UPI0026EEAD75|nr:TolC family protein [Gracilinema caldarium]
MKKSSYLFITLLVGVGVFLIPGPFLYAFDTLDEVVSRYLSQNLDVATAALKVKSSAASLASAPAWRSSSISLSANTAGTLGDVATPVGPTSASSQAGGPTYGASLSVPLTDWFALGASGTLKSDGTLTSSLSATLSPLSGQPSKADIDYRLSLQSYRSTLRSAVLQFRSTLRSLQVSKAEVAYKKAAYDAASTQYEQKQVLLSRGSASQSDVLDALGSLTQARLDYETAEANYQNIHQSIALSLGIADAELPDFTQLLESEGPITDASLTSLMDRETYLGLSDTFVRAKLDAESSQIDARSAQPKPDVSIKGDLSPAAKTWSASAMVKLPLDLLFWDRAAVAKQTADVKEKQAEYAKATVSLEYDQKVQDAKRLYESWKKTTTAYSSAQLVYQQAEVLASLGQKSPLDLNTAQAELLRSAWQLASAEKTLRDALDALSPRFVIEEK